MFEVNVGDVVQLKKAHPCGGYEWVVMRVGVDIGIKCLGCDRRAMLERSAFDHRVSQVVSRGGQFESMKEEG
ncbi:MAG: DUF951 domain-containing protein [Chloroflexota bacterium]|nr:DUF951 domain-containing protein [Chloroflexota bacterium]